LSFREIIWKRGRRKEESVKYKGSEREKEKT
jgi:hypothetical protein